MIKVAESIGWYVGVCNKFPLVDAYLQTPGDPLQIVLVKEALEWFLHQRERTEHCGRIACNT